MQISLKFSAALQMALIIAAAVSVAPAQAAIEAPYSAAAVAAAQARGEPVLVDVAAWWCPVCTSQHSTIKKLVADKRFDKLHIFKLNYDTQKLDWQALGVHRQATLIGYKGKQEVGRIEFQTDADLIQKLLTSTVS